MPCSILSLTCNLKNRIFFILLVLCMLCLGTAHSQYLLVPMDADTQSDHLKAYGISYWILAKGTKIKWLLNYRGGSFLIPQTEEYQKELVVRGVSFEPMSEVDVTALLEVISSPSQNMQEVILEKAPKIAVYTPTDKAPWDDAVTMVLTYAEIPYEKIYDKEVLSR